MPSGESYYMYGDERFINACIQQTTKETTRKFIGKGSFGETFLIKVNNTPYYIKKVAVSKERFPDPTSYKNEIGAIDHEIGANIDVTNKIPEYVSNLKGACIVIMKAGTMAYLIFEAPEGMNLSSFIKLNPPQLNTNKAKYDDIYCKIKASQNAINSVGYIHSDIKPDNIYAVVQNGKVLNCKMIDFGLASTVGTAFIGAGSPLFMPPDMVLNDRMRKGLGIRLNTPKYRGPVLKRHNDYSVNVIWERDFKRKGEPLPKCNGTATAAPATATPNAKKRNTTRKANAKTQPAPAPAPAAKATPAQTKEDVESVIKLLPDGVDLYGYFGITKSADEAAIKKGYRKLALKHHPNRGGDKEVFQMVDAINDILMDSKKRLAYDNYISQGIKPRVAFTKVRKQRGGRSRTYKKARKHA